VESETALDARHHLVLEADVGKGAAHHHFVIAAPGTVLIEVGGLHLVLDKIFARRRIDLDRPGRRDVVGGDGIEQQAQHARIDDVAERHRMASMPTK